MPEADRQFRFIRPIAAGGFGTVYLAKEEHADGFSRVVAIKLLNAQWSDCEEIGGRIRDEARLLGLLRHRNIVDVYDLTSFAPSHPGGAKYIHKYAGNVATEEFLAKYARTRTHWPRTYMAGSARVACAYCSTHA